MSRRSGEARGTRRSRRSDGTDRQLSYSGAGRIKSAFVPSSADPGRLESELRAAVDGEVRFDRGSRALYATDASNYRQVPIGVVIPRTIEDVITTVSIARKHQAPILPRGCGTSLAGQACNVAIVIDFSKYLRRIIELDPRACSAQVEPGCVLDDLRSAAEEHGLTFGPDPATHTHNTLGGMIGNNSGGVHSVMAGLTVDNVDALDILTYDGVRIEVGPTDDAKLQGILRAGGRQAEIYRKLVAFRERYADLIRARFPNIPRRVSGYANLDWLLPERGFHLARALVGTEATCVTILGAKLTLVPNPPRRVVVLLGFDSIFEAADAVPLVLEHHPIAIEGMDSKLIQNMRVKHLHEGKLDIFPTGEGWLAVEFGAEQEDEAVAQASELLNDDRLHAEQKLLRSTEEQRDLQRIRESGLGATAYVPGEPETWEGWEDTAVSREDLGKYLRELRSLLDKYGYDTTMYGHFGDGLVHCRINFDLATEDGLRTWRAFLDEAAELVARYRGSLSGEHGDGEARGALLEKMYGRELVQAFQEFKAIWDDENRMNPGKVLAPFPITANLRVGPEYHPPEQTTRFRYPQDDGSFVRATMRCVGVGKCRRPKTNDGVMCPSYVGTREEMHSTRGRARLLFEMLRREPLESGWRSDEVEEALDLCLACKGCKSDCPVNVDMATYKAEFRARYYAGRLRPRAAYSMGHIYWWARLGGAMPSFANLVMSAPLLGKTMKWLAGISQSRELPHFARPFTMTYTRTTDIRTTERGVSAERVVLWPDTFNNFFTPHVLTAAESVLTRAGFEVVVPPRSLCCGRPLYDWGLIDQATDLLRQTIETLRPEIEQNVPIIGLEPACVSAFRDELPHLLGDDSIAERLSKQFFLFSEFVDRHADRFAFGAEPHRALVQIHCHHHAVIKADAEWSLLQRLGTDVIANPSGCCGMAGGFGFEREKYDVSMRIAEHSLLPAVRQASKDTVIIANGFSCREQIRQATGRRAVHLAEVIAGLQ